jgi:hypothetical protein
MKKSFETAIEHKLSTLELIRLILGHEGALVSMSKSCGPPMATYNSNLVICDKVVWYGDIDLEESKKSLIRLSHLLKTDIQIFYESSLRVFGEPTKKDLALQAKNIKEKNGLVWSTSDPDKFAGGDYWDMYHTRKEHRDEAIKQRQVHFGILTPIGSEWTWYNKWFYKSIYKVYAFIKTYIHVYVVYPINATRWGKPKKFWHWIINPILYFFKEIGYQHNIEGLKNIKIPRGKD